MYPVFRFMKEVVKFRNAPRLALDGTHVSTHICWPWDLDPWAELNNGRTLTLYDLGRIPYAYRIGFVAVVRKHGWGYTVAGNSVRYRRRITAFARFTIATRMLGWDDRFTYLEQTIWRKGECANQILLRMAVTSKTGIVPSRDVLAELGVTTPSPAMPDWVAAWIEADAKRPWPPELPEEALAEIARTGKP